MLSLDSPRWAELQHAYGPADDMPVLLRQLDAMPPSQGQTEPSKGQPAVAEAVLEFSSPGMAEQFIDWLQGQ